MDDKRFQQIITTLSIILALYAVYSLAITIRVVDWSPAANVIPFVLGDGFSAVLAGFLLIGAIGLFMRKRFGIYVCSVWGLIVGVSQIVRLPYFLVPFYGLGPYAIVVVLPNLMPLLLSGIVLWLLARPASWKRILYPKNK